MVVVYRSIRTVNNREDREKSVSILKIYWHTYETFFQATVKNVLKTKDAQQVEPNLYTRYYKLCSIIFWEHIIQKYIKTAY